MRYSQRNRMIPKFWKKEPTVDYTIVGGFFSLSFIYFNKNIRNKDTCIFLKDNLQNDFQLFTAHPDRYHS